MFMFIIFLIFALVLHLDFLFYFIDLSYLKLVLDKNVFKNPDSAFCFVVTFTINVHHFCFYLLLLVSNSSVIVAVIDL